MTNIPTIKTEKMTIEEFVRLQHTEGPFEIIEGERIAKMPTVMGHNDASGNIYTALKTYEAMHGGKTAIEVPFILPDNYDSDWVTGSRIPDVMFITSERFEQYKQDHANWKEKPLILIPDLVVEVVSPNDSFTEIDKKVEMYFIDGVRLVWIVDPQRKKVSIHLPNKNQVTILVTKDTLTGGDVLPEFSVAVEKIFE